MFPMFYFSRMGYMSLSYVLFLQDGIYESTLCFFFSKTGCMSLPYVLFLQDGMYECILCFISSGQDV